MNIVDARLEIKLEHVLTPSSARGKKLKQQDEGLDMLSKSADRLGALSLGISEELGHQNK